MPFQIIRNDLTKVRADVLVNSANPEPVVGGGVDAALHAAAGPKLLRARAAIGSIEAGAAVATPAFRLPAKYVVHTVGPVWQGGGCGEQALLRQCYRNSILTAISLGCKSIAFPLISSGVYGYPKDLALEAAISAIRDYLDRELNILLVVFDRRAYALSDARYADVSAYIDDAYAELHAPSARTRLNRSMGLADEERTVAPLERTRSKWSRATLDGSSKPAVDDWAELGEMTLCCAQPSADAPEGAPRAAAPKESLEARMARLDAGFSEALLKRIDESGRTDAQVYKRANVDRKLFSKIRNRRDYRPTKATALAFAIALELDLDGTRDLIGRAGYALTRSSKFDVIIEYFIENRNYDICEINQVLFAFDQALLGSF